MMSKRIVYAVLGMTALLAALAFPVTAVYPGYNALLTHDGTGYISVVELGVDPPRETLLYECGPDSEVSVPVQSPDGSIALIGLPGRGTVLGFNLSSSPPKFLFEIPVGGRPSEISISPDGTTALIGNAVLPSVAIVNLTSQTVNLTAFDMAEGEKPIAVSFTPDGRHGLIATGSSNGRLLVVSLEGSEPVLQYTIPVDPGPRFLLVNPLGTRALITFSGERKPFFLSVINLSQPNYSEIGRVAIGNSPPGIPTLSPDGKFAFVPITGSYEVAVIDMTAEVPAVISNVPVGKDPGQVVCLPNGTMAFGTTRGASSLVEMSLPAMEIRKRDVLGLFGPYGICIFPEGGQKPPSLAVSGSLFLEAGKSFEYTPVVGDPDSDALITTVAGLPAGARFNGTTITWIPSPDQTGEYPLVFSVSDGTFTSHNGSVMKVFGNGLNGSVIPPPPSLPGGNPVPA